MAGGRVVLPYWTAKQGTLALDVDTAGERLELGRVTPGEVTVSGDRVEVPVPFHVPGDTPVLLRLTRDSGGASAKVPGILRPQGSAALLEAELPVADLTGAPWRVELSPAPDAPEPRFHPLPFALRAKAGTVEVVAVRPPRPSRRKAAGQQGAAAGREAGRPAAGTRQVATDPGRTPTRPPRFTASRSAGCR